ncbi:MAG: hypothetical protein KKF48_00400 [Nanoarchaeota archaeon]|nr:hypothetical protein [Nanoarchaeota archaeon]MBU1027485.1 hypothetical protein [Nanoarchaeota archaeon]
MKEKSNLKWEQDFEDTDKATGLITYGFVVDKKLLWVKIQDEKKNCFYGIGLEKLNKSCFGGRELIAGAGYYVNSGNLSGNEKNIKELSKYFDFIKDVPGISERYKPGFEALIGRLEEDLVSKDL